MRHAGKDLQPILERIRAMEESLPDSLPNLLPYGCDKCDGYGNLIDETGARPCQCKLDYFREKELKRVTMPPEYAQMSFANFHIKTDHQERLASACQLWLKNYNPPEASKGLYIYSASPGVGKTHMAIALLRKLIERGKKGKFTTYQNMVRATWESFKDRERERFFESSAFTKSDFIVIDDFGSGRRSVTDPIREIIGGFIRTCYDLHNTLIITSNIDPDLLTEQFDTTIMSRLAGACYFMDASNITDQRMLELGRIQI